ncbi:MAG: hypothetical protein AAGA54_11995 [Myxococcota bacterium]
MTRNVALLFPALLLACDPAPATSDDTDGGTGGADASTSGDDPAPDPTTGDDPDPEPTTGDDPDPTTGDDPGPDPTTGDDPEPTTGDDPDPTTGDEPDPTTGDDPDPVCGDGMVEGDEVCDDGDDNGAYGSCLEDCSGAGPSCGDGTLDEGFETCDDGELNGDYDQCTADCSGPGPSCGDGSVDGPEACDDGDDNGEYGGCAVDCAGPAAFCGDGNLDAEFEDCDDGDEIDGNGCNNDCVVSGSTLWEVTKTTIGEDSNDLGRQVTLLDDGTLRVSSLARVSENLQQVLITDFDQDGTELDEYVHTNGVYPFVLLDTYGLHPDGTYNLLRWSNGSFNGYNIDARSADSAFQDWSETTEDFRVLRRAGGGGVYINTYEEGSNSSWIILDADGETEAASFNNAGIRYWEVANAEPSTDIVLVESVNVGGGFEPAIARHSTDGTVVFRTFYESDLEDYAGDWASGSTILSVGPEGDIAVSYINNADAVVVVFDADGELQYETVLPREDYGADALLTAEVDFDSQGNVVVVGRRRNSFAFDGMVWKLDASGELLWSRTFEGPLSSGYEAASAVTLLEDDSIVVVGAYTEVFDAADIWVTRLAP